MAFSESDVFDRFYHVANKKCEKCGRTLLYNERGKRNIYYGWEAHHVNHVASGGKDYLSNMRILCWPCHKATF